MENATEVQTHDAGPKRSPFDDLDREELIAKCKGLLALAQKAKHAKIEIQGEVDRYKNELKACELENKSKIESVKTLQELVDSLTEQKLTFITEIDAAHNKLKNLSQKCEMYEQEINDHKLNLKAKDKHFMNASQKLSELDNEVISLKRQNKRLMEENEQLITQLTELESRTEDFNKIGLQQRDQLKILEEKIQSGNQYPEIIEELEAKIKQLESNIQLNAKLLTVKEESITTANIEIEELKKSLEMEKVRNERANNKLKCYKEKILKCANCINQLKNSRFILSKTVKEYSENVPKWQNEIFKASKILDEQIKELNNENIILKSKVHQLQIELDKTVIFKNNLNSLHSELNELKNSNTSLNLNIADLQQKLFESNKINESLNKELDVLKVKFQEQSDALLDNQTHNDSLSKGEIIALNEQLSVVSAQNDEFKTVIQDLKNKMTELNNQLHLQQKHGNADDNLILQLKALESEKAILVKEKLNARDCLAENEQQNKHLTESLENVRSEFEALKIKFNDLEQENKVSQEKYNLEKDDFCNKLKKEIMTAQDKYEALKKQFDNLQDLNGLLQEEVETLKLSLEQPKEDEDNLPGINVSLQADIVKLETKLSSYKQENASLLAEVKESRGKIKEFDNLVVENEEAKSKLLSYKTENAELLNEMKEINQVLKERGEAISKLQKAILEMERLIETLEKDRDCLKEEKNSLLNDIERLENDLKNATQNCSMSDENLVKLTIERDNALKCLQEKTDALATLKEEMEKLKQQSPSDLPNEDMSTSTISKAEEHARMRDLDETFEDKYTKLRIFALKLKKKLNETTAQLQISEQEKIRLRKSMNDQTTDNSKANAGQHALDSDISCTTPDKVISDLTNEINSLKSNIETLEKQCQKLEVDLQSKSKQLSSEIEAHKTTKEHLEKALKDVKKKNVLSLEMEDYERSMKELSTKMEDSKKKIIQMESTIDTQEGTITTMKTQIKLLEEQIKSEETQNRLIREELHHALEESKEKDNVINLKNNFIANLTQDLEEEKRKKEEVELEITAALSEKEKIIVSLGEDKIELNNKLKKLEFKYAELNDKLQITNIELADLKAEYSSYKVRAQSVLRQNQTIDHSQEEQLKEEVAALKTQIETLTQKLSIMQQQCDEKTSEMEAYRKRAAEAGAEAARASARTTRAQADLNRLSHTLDAERAQHKLQISTLSQCYKSQIVELEAKLQKETESLKKQLALLQENANQVKLDNDMSRDKYMLPIIPKEDASDVEMDINVSMIPREEGEGSESAPSPPLSKSFMAGSGRRSPVPLERLLEEGVSEEDTLDRSSLALTPEQEITDLKRKVQAHQQKAKHVTVLLAESERECARLSQLSELLKAELRRVRGSAPAEHNTEYMKNVTLKFLTLPPGDERSRLIPVLQKILTLSQEETLKIQAIAKGQDPNANKGWGSYLPWPGGK